MEEKRKYKRIPLEGNLAITRIDEGKTDVAPIVILDISKSGLGFECARELELNSVYELELVLWTKERINTFINIIRAGENNGRRTYGATFVGMSEKDSCKIDIYDMFRSYND